MLGALTLAVILVFGASGFQPEALNKERHPVLPKAASKHIVRPTPPVTKYSVSLPLAASNAVRELAGSGDGSPVGWSPDKGLWGTRESPPRGAVRWVGSPWWWQSALDLRGMVRYLEQTHNTDPAYEQVIEQTYRLNVLRPGTHSPVNFGNEFMDDTAWWGLAWLEAARYELNVRHDFSEATRYLLLAEWDANYVWNSPRPCRGGIEWERGSPPDTVTNAEFADLAARLAQVRRQPGPWHDTAAAVKWWSEAHKTIWWLHASKLVNLRTGHVWDMYDKTCTISGGSLPYTEGETADALTQMALATGNKHYLIEAKHFIDWSLSSPKSRMLDHGILQEPCESENKRCLDSPRLLDATSWKSLFVDAVADWRAASGSTAYDGFLSQQARAVLNASSDGQQLTPCRLPHDCQIGFYWARPVAPSEIDLVGPASQEAGLSVLTDALALSTPVARPGYLAGAITG